MIKKIPAIIWIYWHQGWENAPEICRQCLQSWQLKNPDWTIHILIKKNLHQFIHPEKLIYDLHKKEMPYEAYSDIVRIFLLEQYGGVWVDSTVLCIVPLDEWLLPQLENPFFAFANPAPGRMLGTWFLASAPEHYIVKKWREQTIRYWNENSKRHNYYWSHHLFGDLYKEDSRFKKEWDDCFKIHADIPHYFVPYADHFYRAMIKQDQLFIDNKESPLFKLTHKYDIRLVPSDSVHNYLLYGVDGVRKEDLLRKIKRKLYLLRKKIMLRLKRWKERAADLVTGTGVISIP